MRISDWSSDVCSSDLSCKSQGIGPGVLVRRAEHAHRRPVVLQLRDRVAHVAQRGMRRLLAHPRQYLRRPAPRKLLDRAHVEVAVVEVTLQRRHQEVRSEEHKSELQSLMRHSYA